MARIEKILAIELGNEKTSLLALRMQKSRQEQFTQWMERDFTLESAEKMLLDGGVDKEVIKKIVDDYATFLKENIKDPQPRLLRVSEVSRVGSMKRMCCWKVVNMVARY
ncbi:unnamed protein product [Peronospora destructor]|uniref:Uncharacterized protein n=1 Tax=Peronospora destructor TaxID=86335 RepID=A0AAV0VD45_9STRA|nr:unnamed protein product [Peronospora destructor]